MANKPKCHGCGRYLAAQEGITCTKCICTYHKLCVKIPKDAPTSIITTWVCPECKAKVPRDNNTDTPVKGAVVTGSQSGREQDDGDGDGEGVLAMELKLFRDELSAMRLEMAGFRVEITKFNATFQELSDRVSKVEDRVSTLESRVSESGCDRESAEFCNTIEQLKSELNDRDQELLLNDVEIAGVPEVINENPLHVSILLAKKLGIDLDERDVVSVQRVGALQSAGRRRRGSGEREALDAGGAGGGSAAGVGGDESAVTGRPRVLAVRFARRSLRDDLLRAARVRRGADTADLDLPGPPSRFYVNERLTRTNRQLFYRTRQECSRLGWKYAWTKDGRMLVRQEAGKTVHRIRSEADIVKTFGNC